MELSKRLESSGSSSYSTQSASIFLDNSENAKSYTFMQDDVARMAQRVMYSAVDSFYPSKLSVMTDGRNRFHVTDCFAIPASGKNKEIAWDLIKFMVEADEADRDAVIQNPANADPQRYSVNSSWVPINRDNFLYFYENYTIPQLTLFPPEGYIPTDEDKQRTLDYVQQIDEWNSKVNFYPCYDLDFDLAISAFYLDYCKDIITAEEAAQGMQSKAEIYLNE